MSDSETEPMFRGPAMSPINSTLGPSLAILSSLIRPPPGSGGQLQTPQVLDMGSTDDDDEADNNNNLPSMQPSVGGT